MQIFDIIYYVLAIAMTLFLVVATVLGLRTRARSTDPEDRRWGLGASLTSLGALITITESVFLTALYRSSSIGGFLYLQAQFSIAYVAIAMVLFGIDTTLLSKMQLRVKRSLTQIRIFVWGTYFLAIAISSFFLFNPNTYKITYSGSVEHVAQQLVFWLPLFLTLIVGAFTASAVALRSSDTFLRRFATWFALFSLLIFLGTLRESTIIPSSGDPLVDLFVAFGPFVAGSFCILMSVGSREEKPKIEAGEAARRDVMEAY